MIRYRWDAVVSADRALQRGEWAGVRLSTAAERKAIEAGRKDVCNTFVFQGCGHVLRLIVTKESPQPGFHRRVAMATTIRSAIAKQAPRVPQPYSSAVFAAALALAPAAVVDLRRVQASMRCAGCSCVLRAGGPIEIESAQGAYITEQAMNSKFAQGRAAQ